MYTRTIKHIILFLFFISMSLALRAQLTQTLRGTVIDPILQSPVTGATVLLVSANRTVTTDGNGSFRFSDVPVGSQQLRISSVGYKEATIDNIVIIAGKETILNLPLEIDVKTQKEVVVVANSRKNRPLNELSAVSARAFTVEETQRYAAAVNDPLRMATAFAGVVSTDDGNNQIAIRGNSPTGLLWKMEGMDIPNPNHFSNAGSSGGGISILSAQLLSNSDFVTGAFAPEYGNALSGVFDLKLRKGNNNKREYSLQAGLLGLNVSAEGPLMPHYNGSYLVNYRYSTLSLLDKIGVNVGDGENNFQDLSYNIFIPTNNAGNFTFFGFGGLSSTKLKPDYDSSKWERQSDRYPYTFRANTGMTGITHNYLFGSRTSLRSAVGLSYVENGGDEHYLEDNKDLSLSYRENYQTKKWLANSTLAHRFNNRNLVKTGFILNLVDFNFYQRAKENPNAPLEERINVSGNAATVQGFAEWQHKKGNNLTFNTGLHFLTLTLNNTYSVEPRASVKWDLSKKQSIAFAYGLHGQVQPWGIYFAERQNAGGGIEKLNRDLEFTKAHHFVLSHQYSLGKNLRLKTELYYQHLQNVPVSTSDTNTFSTLNILGEYVAEAFVNKGKGKNYGIELALEKYLDKNMYYMVNTSLYQSKYTAADGKERNTRFNGNYVVNVVGGKDFVSANGLRTFGVNIKTVYSGGFRTTPIDIARSKAEGYTVLHDEQAFSLQNPAYFRTDLRVSMKWNKRNLTSTLSLDIQNVSNRQNIYNQSFDKLKGEVVTNYQTGLIPVLNYKVEF
ncbi:MAG: TonB-dependent receptor [Gemmatimonadaceae bacterium]|nr:TonB-dependent receptor [Chitinophagaceae bacterium]